MEDRKKAVFRSVSGKKQDKMTTGDKSRQQKKMFRKRTGNTALPDREIFLNTSYRPNREAEIKAGIIHIAEI